MASARGGGGGGSGQENTLNKKRLTDSPPAEGAAHILRTQHATAAARQQARVTRCRDPQRQTRLRPQRQSRRPRTTLNIYQYLWIAGTTPLSQRTAFAVAGPCLEPSTHTNKACTREAGGRLVSTRSAKCELHMRPLRWGMLTQHAADPQRWTSAAASLGAAQSLLSVGGADAAEA